MNISYIWTWTWHNALMTFNDWQINQPNSNYRCVALSIGTALWSAQNCEVKKPFVCQIPAVVPVCDPAWSYFTESGMCYKLFAQLNTTFYMANELCLNQSATLTSVHTNSENTFISQMATFVVPEKWQDEAVWIGLEYKDNSWKWADNTTYNGGNWGPNHPNNFTTGYCAWLYPDGLLGLGNYEWQKKWNEAACLQEANRFICKKKPGSVYVV